jgi:hypothetical protein
MYYFIVIILLLCYLVYIIQTNKGDIEMMTEQQARKIFEKERKEDLDIRKEFPNTKRGFYMWCAEWEDLAHLAYNAGYISYMDMYCISEEFRKNNQGL